MSEMLAWFLRSPVAKRQFDESELGTGVPRLNIGDIRQFTIPVAPAAEQKRIVARIEALLSEVSAIRAHLGKVCAIVAGEVQFSGTSSHTDRLTQSILAKAFDGELVPTEAELARQEKRDYEPASVLLERIRAHRDAPPLRVTATAPKARPLERGIRRTPKSRQLRGSRAYRRK